MVIKHIHSIQRGIPHQQLQLVTLHSVSPALDSSPQVSAQLCSHSQVYCTTRDPMCRSSYVLQLFYEMEIVKWLYHDKKIETKLRGGDEGVNRMDHPQKPQSHPVLA